MYYFFVKYLFKTEDVIFLSKSDAVYVCLFDVFCLLVAGAWVWVRARVCPCPGVSVCAHMRMCVGVVF